MRIFQHSLLVVGTGDIPAAQQRSLSIPVELQLDDTVKTDSQGLLTCFAWGIRAKRLNGQMVKWPRTAKGRRPMKKGGQ